MAEEKGIDEEDRAIGHLVGKTTVASAKLLVEDPKVGKNNYVVLYGDKDENGKREYHILDIIEMWHDKKGMMAKVQVLGDRPSRPFERGAKVYLAKEAQIREVLGIDNPPEKSVALGKLLGYDFDVNLMVKNFGRIFITGKSGSGKSYTMGVLCEEFLKKGIPVVILDRHGEYGSLKVASEDLDGEEEVEEEVDESIGYCPWCGENIPKEVTICPECGEELTSEVLEEPPEKKTEEKEAGEESKESNFVDNIIEFADLKINKAGDLDMEYLFSLDEKDIVAPNLCTIINLRGLNLEIQETIAGKLLKRLYQASTSRKIPPFYLFLDEAHLFAGKKRTETSETVKLFSQEGRKFGANLVIGTQRPQLLDTTIRAQAGTWIVHQLSDVRDIGITISSAEDLTKENKDDIAGLDKGEAILSGEAVSGIPLFVKIRKRRTEHGGIGFNALDFLSEDTLDEMKKRKERILGKKSSEELEMGKTIFEELKGPRSSEELLEEIAQLKMENKELRDEKERLKEKLTELQEQQGTPLEVTDETLKELQTQVDVWKEKYNYLKNQQEKEGGPRTEGDQGDLLLELRNKIIELQAQVKKYKSLYDEALLLAEKSIKELKKHQNPTKR
ncbi:MAG: AAA-like domain protein [Promethearchaeota archaeon]|nr:MAG: AAA-like domain protein [Candidatus Lokiarchaeota archaeon]